MQSTQQLTPNLADSQSSDDLHLSIVVPVFNEDESLPELSDWIRSVCEPAGYAFEVIFIDDGSSDDSWQVINTISEADPRFKGIKFRRNYGKSAALAVAFDRVVGKYVVTMDADLQDDPNEIPGMLAKLEAGADLVSGWKKKRHDPLGKTIPSRLFNGITSKISGIKLHDFNCGLKAYKNAVVKNVRVYGELHRYIPLLAKWEGYTKIEEQIVQHHPRKFGVSKFGLERFVRGFLDLISVVFLTQFAARPMHFFGTIGTVSFAGGFFVNLYLTIQWFMGQPLTNRPILFLGMLLIIVGVQTFLAGLLGEMLVRPRMEKPSNFDIEAETA